MLEEKKQPLWQLNDAEAVSLCGTLRRALLGSVSQTGGHLASNLGVVELTVALHRVYDLEEDRLVFDVGHQCYVHKMLTGREDKMGTLRQFGGLSGFPRPWESKADAFVAGHASNAVSVALGMARARTLLHQNHHVIALLGDGALTGGLAYEGLSNAGQSGEPMLVILNDNGMSIQENVGGIANLLAHQRLKPHYLRFKKGYRKVMNALPGGQQIYRVTHKLKQGLKEAILSCSMFEEMGFTYIGPVDGHDVAALTRLLQWIKTLKTPVLLHVRTVKGKGCDYAEQTPDAYHGVSPFDPETGVSLARSGQNFSAVFGDTMCQMAEEDGRVCAITAAMQSGCGLDHFAKSYPNRFFDTGIAEGHAATMAGGMAKQGLLPVFAVYSTFLQRSYDMLLHDIAIDNLHVVLAVDRAGLVGEDGETHHGVFDIAYLSSVPQMRIFCPASFQELRSMLRRAAFECEGPVAVRYPRGGEGAYREDAGEAAAVCLRQGTDITLVGYGVLINALLEAAALLETQDVQAEVVKLNELGAGLDAGFVCASVAKTKRLLVLEDCVNMGSAGQQLAAALAVEQVATDGVWLQNLGAQFVEHGAVSQLRTLHGLTAQAVAQKALSLCRERHEKRVRNTMDERKKTIGRSAV